MKRRIVAIAVLFSFLLVALATFSVQACRDGEGRDVAAYGQSVEEAEIMPGDIVDIEVTVGNRGDVTETFDLTCYAGDIEVGTVRVLDLAPGETRVVTFQWDTTGVPEGRYKIKAWADSSEEIDERNEWNNRCRRRCKLFVIPELPIGTVVAAGSMFAALGGYVKFKGVRPK